MTALEQLAASLQRLAVDEDPGAPAALLPGLVLPTAASGASKQAAVVVTALAMAAACLSRW
jgi:hypothetical protein